MSVVMDGKFGYWNFALLNSITNVTKDRIIERMAVAPDKSWAVPGTLRQPPPEQGREPVMSEFIKSGEWGPAFNAQNKVLDEHSKKYNPQDQDWQKQKPCYKPVK